MKQIYALFIFFFSFSTAFSQIGANHTSTTTGTLSGVPFTISFSNTAGLALSTGNFSISQFSAAPLASNQNYIQFGELSNWTLTFNSPIPNLRMYLYFWRDASYLSDQPFTILSGNANLTNPSGNNIVTTQFASGIIEFTNPITTLNFTSLGVDNDLIGMTFGLQQALGLDDVTINTAKKLQLYPNPSNDFIQIYGLDDTENYTIYNVLGSIIAKSTTTSNERINIQNFEKGIYFLKLKNGNTFKFIKE